MKTQGRIILRLDSVDQLVETRHPSPFPTPRLRTEAEQYIVERLADLPSTSTAKLVIALPRSAAVDTRHVTESVHDPFHRDARLFDRLEHAEIDSSPTHERRAGAKKTGLLAAGVGSRARFMTGPTRCRSQIPC